MADIEKITPEIQLLSERMQGFENLLMAEGKPVGPLWKAWHYLQLYSIWGLRLPSNETTLSLALGSNELASYGFYPPLLKGLGGIAQASEDFSTRIFPQVVKVGQQIRAFGGDAVAEDSSTFSAILEFIDEDSSKEDIITLMGDLQQQASKNAEEAKAVNEVLTGYQENLAEAKTQMNAALKAIKDRDQDKGEGKALLSDDQIVKLNAGPEVEGSLAYYQAQMDVTEQDYDEYVKIAATTPTYAWVFPYGTFAAVVVAGVYGDRAVKALDSLAIQRSEYEAKENELQFAYKANEVCAMAQIGIAKATTYTDLAIEQVELVQQAWEGFSDSLDYILNKFKKTTKEVNQQQRLRSRSQVKNFVRLSRKKWESLWPAIQLLTDEPYISVDTRETSVGEAMEALQVAIANPPKN